MIPATVNVLEQCLSESDEENASKIFEVFDTLLMLVSQSLRKEKGIYTDMRRMIP